MALVACGGGADLPPEPTTDPSINITGSFVGPVTANLPTRTDVTRALLQLVQAGGSVSGTYSAENGRSAEVSGSVSGAQLTLAVAFTDACAGSASATADATSNATRLSGTYTANDCLGSYSGGFVLDKDGASPPPPAARFTLHVSVVGSGTVTSSVGGINCSTGSAGTCSAEQDREAHVELTAVPAAGYVLSGWGGACAGIGDCAITMDRDHSITATFSARPPPPPTIELSANPLTITGGQASTLTWASTDASECSASDGWSGTRPLAGTESVVPPTTTTYTLTCSSAGGLIVKSVTVTVIASPALPNCTHTGDVSRTPDYHPYRPVMEQVVPGGPLYVTSSAAVVPCVLLDAGYMLHTMLRNLAHVALTLRDAGTLTAVFGRAESVCDLPYFSDLRQLDPSKCDERGGLGGVTGRYATACSEANILRDPADPFGRGTRPDGENVCVHELAHTIMNIGLSDAERAAIRQRFQAVTSEGELWTQDAFGNPTFALTNADEFWAEMTQAYFCANPGVSAFLHNGVNCADQLQQYDPETFRLMEGVYGQAGADLR